MKHSKTGIITDLRMLNHKSKKNHPESPLRLETILKLLEEKKYLNNDQIDYIPTYERFANDEEIGLVYAEKYISYVKSIWPKASHRTDITILDTYFNEQSQQVARLSTGGVLEGIDNIMNQNWKNGFSLIRPPGHHSGGRNTINGFCIFNNIAIGARYLQKRYSVEKILVLDYDIHMGDGTHHIFKEDPNILFFSVHRFDHGTYYPAGEIGSHQNCGSGSAEGTKLNIPLNYQTKQETEFPYQAPGDNEYIYIYNRIIHPIIQQFNPDFILVSSGFDAARNDPVGGFTVTPNAYYYMTRRLKQFNKPMLCVLEGGYNVNELAEAVVGVMKGLVGEEELPEPVPKVTYENMDILCHLQKKYHENIDQIIEHHSKYWKSLISESQLKYTKAIKQNTSKVYGVVHQQLSSPSTQEQKLLENKIQNNEQKLQVAPVQAMIQSESTSQFYFAAGHMQRFKNLSINNDRIMKWAYKQQRIFYESDFPEKQFAPKYYGDEGQFVIIQNILYKQQDPIILDIKLSRQSQNPKNNPQKIEKEIKKETLSTSHKYSFRIGGFTTPQYKQGGMLISDQAINKKILRKVVTTENKEHFCSFLRNLAQSLKQSSRHYYGTSILLVKGKEKSCIKWVDFHYWYDKCSSYDQSVVEGLQNLQEFILSIDDLQ